MILNVTVKNKKAELAAPAVIVCRNSDYKIKFAFDEEWSAAHIKTARFFSSGIKTDVAFTGDVCDVPKLRNTTGVYIGVYAGDLRTTTPAFVPCEISILDMGGENDAPPADVYTQLVALAEETAETAETANTNAKTAVETANEAKETADNVTAAEQGRVEAEAARAAAEQGRTETEAARAAAEQGRTETEAARAAAEQGRTETEAARVAAEQTRAEAEAQRATAEQSRAAAEVEREAAINAAAPSIVNTAAGEFITVKEAANRSIVGLKVIGKTAEGGKCVKEGTKVRSSGKNFVEITADSSRTLGGLTVSLTATNNTCIINGIVGGTNSFSTTYTAKLAAGTYTASVVGLNTIDSRADRIYIFDAGSREILINYITTRNAGTFTLNEAREVGITFVFATGSEYNNAHISVQIEAGTAATAIEAPISGGEITTPCNLFDGDVWHPLMGIVERSDGSAEAYAPQMLSACYGVTNITQMPVELTAALYMDYVADTKLYIDNKFAELANI